jgi:hypothetical protein
MHLYTFIMEFRGGTYISQINAASPHLACIEWAKRLQVQEVPGLGQSGQLGLIKEMQEEEPVQIQDAQSVWCVSARIHGPLALVNLVDTASLDGD